MKHHNTLRRRTRCCAPLLLALFSTQSAANLQAAERGVIIDEIVVTASRTVMPLTSVGSAIDVLTAEDIAARPRFQVSDLLREVPGVSVNRSGQMGSQTQVRLRGAEANHTLVLINGIEVGDPFTVGEFDFANLLTDDVERIEILRGPQSALYGAQAIGGVINVITTQGKGPAKFTAQAQGGSFGTFSGSGAANGGGDGYGFAGAAAYLKTAGISQAARGTERDGHTNLTLNLSGRADLSELFDVSLAARYTRAFGEEDTQDFTPGSPTQGLAIDSDDFHRTKTIYARGTGRLKLFEGAWEHIAAAAITDVRKSNYGFGAFSFGSYGRKMVASYQTNATLTDATHGLSHVLTGYVELKDEAFENKSGFPGPQNQRKSTLDKGYVGEYRLGVRDQVFLSAAVRYDDTDMFKNATTYRATAAWQVPGTGVKLRASYGTGLAKPGFFELFGFDPTSFVGNPNLKPETSRGWDVGADLSLVENTAYLSASYFSTNLEHEIFTDFTVFPFTVRNQNGISKRDGVEISARYTPIPAFSLAASYTYTNTKDDRGLQEVRRPKTIASLSGSYRFLEDRATIGLSADHNGKMQDVVFTPTIPSGKTTMKAYTLVTVSATYDVTKSVEVFGRIENVLDQRYQEIFSYNTMGAGVYGGLRLRFGG